jgi:hypothetical protein
MKTWFVRLPDDSNNGNYDRETAEEAVAAWAAEEWADNENWWDGETVVAWADGVAPREFVVRGVATFRAEGKS